MSIVLYALAIAACGGVGAVVGWAIAGSIGLTGTPMALVAAFLGMVAATLLWIAGAALFPGKAMSARDAAHDPGIVERLLAAADGGAQLAPITDADPHFGVERAYETLATLHAHRVSQGWKPVGRKIGFTNRTIWPRYGVYRPMWSMVWDRTVVHAPGGAVAIDVNGLHEPRIEPELVFGLAAPLPAEGDARAC